MMHTQYLGRAQRMKPQTEASDVFLCVRCEKPMEGEGAFDPRPCREQPAPRYMHPDCRKAELEDMAAERKRMERFAPELFSLVEQGLEVILDGSVGDMTRYVRRLREVIAEVKGRAK